MRALVIIAALVLAVGCKSKAEEKQEAETEKPYEPPPFEPEIDPPDAQPERVEHDEQSLVECIHACVAAGREEEEPPPDLRKRCVNACTERCVIICVDRAEVRHEEEKVTRAACQKSCRLDN